MAERAVKDISATSKLLHRLMLCMKKVWLPHLDLTGEFAALASECGHALHRRILMKKSVQSAV